LPGRIKAVDYLTTPFLLAMDGVRVEEMEARVKKSALFFVKPR
jgi:hypothetical protein